MGEQVLEEARCLGFSTQVAPARHGRRGSSAISKNSTLLTSPSFPPLPLSSLSQQEERSYVASDRSGGRVGDVRSDDIEIAS